MSDPNRIWFFDILETKSKPALDAKEKPDCSYCLCTSGQEERIREPSRAHSPHTAAPAPHPRQGPMARGMARM